MPELYHSPGITGSFDDGEHGPFDIDNGVMVVPDAAVARELVDTYPHKFSWHGDAPETGETPNDDEPESDTCEAVVQSTGAVCGRDLPCPYHTDE